MANLDLQTDSAGKLNAKTVETLQQEAQNNRAHTLSKNENTGITTVTTTVNGVAVSFEQEG